VKAACYIQPLEEITMTTGTGKDIHLKSGAAQGRIKLGFANVAKGSAGFARCPFSRSPRRPRARRRLCPRFCPPEDCIKLGLPIQT